MEIKTCAVDNTDVIRVLETEKTLTLATCADNRVTIRPMSHVNDGLTVYFQTGKDYLKIRQIEQNPLVAMCVGTYEIEGAAELVGHPLADESLFFIEKLKAKHPGAFERWSTCEDEIVVKIEPRKIRQWKYINDEPFLAKTDY